VDQACRTATASQAQEPQPQAVRRMQRTIQRSPSGWHLPGRCRRFVQLHRQRREPRTQFRARRRNRRTQPRAVVYGTARRAAAGRTPHPPPVTSAITAPTVSATSSRQASTNAGNSAWLTRHARSAAAARRSSGSGPPPGHDASSPTTTPGPGARRARRTGELHLPPSRHVRIDRQRAGPYHGHGRHRLGSLPRPWPNEGEEGSLTFQRGHPRSWPAQAPARDGSRAGQVSLTVAQWPRRCASEASSRLVIYTVGRDAARDCKGISDI
jgi:hypothetical protein